MHAASVLEALAARRSEGVSATTSEAVALLDSAIVIVISCHARAQCIGSVAIVQSETVAAVLFGRGPRARGGAHAMI
jgi:hypothetical protein